MPSENMELLSLALPRCARGSGSPGFWAQSKGGGESSRDPHPPAAQRQESGSEQDGRKLGTDMAQSLDSGGSL